MKNNGGYVKVFRSMLDWEWYDDTACVRLMLHLLLTANWEAKSWHGQTIEPGQLITSMDKLAETLGTSRSAIRRTLDKLKSSGEVTIQTNNHWTTVTLANWAEYQEVQPTTDQPSGRQTTNHRPTTDRPPATTKEEKHLRIEEGKKEEARVVWPSWAGERTLATWEEFKTYRLKEHKARYKSTDTEQRAVDILAKYFTDGPTCVAALEHSIGKGWQFPVDPTEYKYPAAKKVEATWNARA